MQRLVIVLMVALLASSAAQAAHADDGVNYLVGPVFGYSFRGRTGGGLLVGVEGGVGSGPERINLGVEQRDAATFGYFELDPWFLLGGSLGLGVDSHDDLHPILGLWEGAPILYGTGCGAPIAQHPAVTIAVGWRWTGVHEVYVTVKAGSGSGRSCFD